MYAKNSIHNARKQAPGPNVWISMLLMFHAICRQKAEWMEARKVLPTRGRRYRHHSPVGVILFFHGQTVTFCLT